jgi:hypothetical protein
MAAVFGNLYDALRGAGVPDDKARAAAEELFEQTAEVGIMRAAIGQLQTDMTSVKRDIVDLKSGFAVMRWMLGFNIAMTVAIVGKLFLAH